MNHRPGNPHLSRSVAARWWDLADSINELAEVALGPRARAFVEKWWTGDTKSPPSVAYDNAFSVAEVAGPMKMAEDLNLVGLPLEQLAEKAAEDYQEWARADAKRGTLDGFEAYIERGEDQVAAL